MEMKVVRESDDLTYVALAGGLDVAGVKEIETKFETYITSRMKPVIVDMSQVTYLASLGMRMLLRVARALKPSGGKLAVLKPKPFVEEALKLASLDQVFGIAHDEEKAVELALGA
jgi:anti-anti-sigma factor